MTSFRTDSHVSFIQQTRLNQSFLLDKHFRLANNTSNCPKKELKTMPTPYVLQGKLAFVMGGGKFGTNALKYLKNNGAKVLIADLNPKCMAKSQADIQTDNPDIFGSLLNGQSAFLQGNAIDLLLQLLEHKIPDLIVTAIPGNAVAKIVESWLSKRNIKLEPNKELLSNVLENIPSSLVSVADPETGVIVVSYMPADKRCRENCVPPKTVCATTGRPKLAPMDKILNFCIYGLADVSAVLVSKQLTGGLGGIEGKDIVDILKELDNRIVPYSLAVGTACDCHGVLNLSKTTKS
jgi:hypothetical protein